MSKPKTPQQEFIDHQVERWLAEKGEKVEPIFLRFKNITKETKCLFLEPWGTWVNLEPEETAVVVSFYPLQNFSIDITGDEGCITLHCDEPTKVFNEEGNLIR